MCLIILCPKGTDKNSDFLKKSIRKAAITNKDGMGFMYKEGNNILVDKGYTNPEDLIKSLETYKFSNENGLLAIHLRIGNKGAITPEMCHPFICAEEDAEISLLQGATNRPVMMHNGTFIGLTLEKDKSDTFIFAKKFMSDENISGLFNKNTELFKEIFKSVLSVSRVLVFYPDDRDYTKVGAWIEEDGYFFSNETFRNDKIKDVGGVTHSTGKQNVIDFKKASNNYAERASSRKDDNFPSNGVSNLLIDDTGRISYTRVTRVDLIKERLFKPHNPDFKDILDYDYKVFRGIYGTEDKTYINDEVSFEFLVNPFNYKFVTLQAKETIDSLNMKDNVFYKIDKVLYNPTEEKHYVIIHRLISNIYDNTPIYLGMDEISVYFSVRPKNDHKSSALYRMYLDAVCLISDHNKTLKRILKNIKGKHEFALLNVGKKEFPFPVIVLKWFVFECKRNHGLKTKQIKDFLEKV